MKAPSSALLLLLSIASGVEIPELAYLDPSVDPCENFYEFSCGNFGNVRPRPQRMPLWDHFLILQEELHDLARRVLQSEIGEDDPAALRRAQAVYFACMDLTYLNELRVPEAQIMEEEGGWPLIANEAPRSGGFQWNDVATLVANYGVQLFFTIQVTPYVFDANEIVISINRDPVLNPSIHPRLPENSVNFLKSYGGRSPDKHPFATFLENIALYLRNVVGSFKSQRSIQDEVGQIIDFMLQVQRGGMVNETIKGNLYGTVSDLQAWTDRNFGDVELNWLEFLNRFFSKSGRRVSADSKVLVNDLKTFYGVLNLVRNSGESLVKNFIFTRLFTYTSQDSNDVIRGAYEQFRVDMGDVVYTRPEYCARKALDFPEGIGLSMALTHHFQRYHFDVNKLKLAEEMVEDLREVFKATLRESDWLDEETRDKALLKAEKMITLLGYPDFVEEPELVDRYHENIKACAWDHFGNAQTLRAFGLATNLALLGKPRDREVWQLSPLVANAFYNAQNNRILLPVSMLNPVFFEGREEHSPLDYGRLGMVIGHEITHGFDSMGRMYDENGTFTMGWWSPATSAEYAKKTRCFVDQYGKYYIEEIDQYVNPNNTLRENLADNGGLSEAFKAFQELQKRKSFKKIEEYTPEQLFFIGFATQWCTLQTDAYLHTIHKSGYPPARFRVNGAVSNSEAFAKAFRCPAGSAMNPETKCVLW